jgi:hypothetical protein
MFLVAPRTLTAANFFSPKFGILTQFAISYLTPLWLATPSRVSMDSSISSFATVSVAVYRHLNLFPLALRVDRVDSFRLYCLKHPSGSPGFPFSCPPSCSLSHRSSWFSISLPPSSHGPTLFLDALLDILDLLLDVDDLVLVVGLQLDK